MNKLLKGLTYSYRRNIGWQDRTVRTIFGILAVVGAVYLYSTSLTLAIILAGLFLAQVVTVLSSKCPICYFTGLCTISGVEKKSLIERGIPYEG